MKLRTAPAFDEMIPFEITRMDDGIGEIEAEITDAHLNAAGVCHGGVLAALMDVCVTLAAGNGPGATPENRKFGVTLSMTTNYVAGARKGRITAKGRCTGGGRKTVFADAEMFDSEGRLVCTATSTVKLIDQPSGYVKQE
jgi:uncharacterized protein (TIGR00369 family)